MGQNEAHDANPELVEGPPNSNLSHPENLENPEAIEPNPDPAHDDSKKIQGESPNAQKNVKLDQSEQGNKQDGDIQVDISTADRTKLQLKKFKELFLATCNKKVQFTNTNSQHTLDKRGKIRSILEDIEGIKFDALQVKPPYLISSDFIVLQTMLERICKYNKPFESIFSTNIQSKMQALYSMKCTSNFNKDDVYYLSLGNMFVSELHDVMFVDYPVSSTDGGDTYLKKMLVVSKYGSSITTESMRVVKRNSQGVLKKKLSFYDEKERNQTYLLNHQYEEYQMISTDLYLEQIKPNDPNNPTGDGKEVLNIELMVQGANNFFIKNRMKLVAEEHIPKTSDDNKYFGEDEQLEMMEENNQAKKITSSLNDIYAPIYLDKLKREGYDQRSGATPYRSFLEKSSTVLTSQLKNNGVVKISSDKNYFLNAYEKGMNLELYYWDNYRLECIQINKEHEEDIIVDMIFDHQHDEGYQFQQMNISGQNVRDVFFLIYYNNDYVELRHFAHNIGRTNKEPSILYRFSVAADERLKGYEFKGLYLDVYKKALLVVGTFPLAEDDIESKENIETFYLNSLAGYGDELKENITRYEDLTGIIYKPKDKLTSRFDRNFYPKPKLNHHIVYLRSYFIDPYQLIETMNPEYIPNLSSTDCLLWPGTLRTDSDEKVFLADPNKVFFVSKHQDDQTDWIWMSIKGTFDVYHFKLQTVTSTSVGAMLDDDYEKEEKKMTYGPLVFRTAMPVAIMKPMNDLRSKSRLVLDSLDYELNEQLKDDTPKTVESKLENAKECNNYDIMVSDNLYRMVFITNIHVEEQSE